MVTRDGGNPLTWHAYPGDKPDVTQFPAMIDQLRRRYEAITAAAGRTSGSAEMTVVFDAGQNSADNFAHLAGSGLHYIGSVPISDCPDLAALPATVRTVVDARFEGLTAHDTRREVYGTVRRTILTHSPELHESQARGFEGTTLAKAGTKLDALAATLARGKTRRPRAAVEAEIAAIPAPPGCAASSPGSDRRRTRRPAPGMEHRHHRPRGAGRRTVRQARADHRPRRLAGRRGLTGYRSQSEAEFAFRQLNDPHVVSFSPMHHWTEHNIRVHTFTCVLALQIAHLMRHRARRARLRLSVPALLGELAASRRPSCSTKATAADPKHAACSPKPTPPRTPSPSSSTSTATHPVRSYTHSPPKQQQHNGKPEPRPCLSETQARSTTGAPGVPRLIAHSWMLFSFK